MNSLNLLQSAKFKLFLVSFILFMTSFFYIYTSYLSVKENLFLKNKKEIYIQYQIYNKFFKSNSLIKDILIKNPNYIDNEEFVEEYSKSMPIVIAKKRKNESKYFLTIKFLTKDIKKLREKEYMVYEENKSITLFGKVGLNKYILINKPYDLITLKNQFDTFFRDVSVLVIINLVLFFYFLNLIKKHKDEKYFMEQEYKFLQEDTKKIAFEDRLTGAATRLKFDETLKDLIQISSRFEEQKFCLLILDIDNFKSVNDNYGHDYGDIVLKEVARVVKENIRGSDTFARWGGEEFVVLLPMNSLDKALVFANKIRVLISKIKFEKIEKITCSMGLVEFEFNDDEETIIKRADELLYKAKHDGKNNVKY